MAGDGATVMFSVGARNSSAIRLINSALHVKFPLPNLSKSSSLPSLVADANPSGPLVLALEGVDAATSPSPLDNTMALAVSLAGVIVLSLRFSDLTRSSASGIPELVNAVAAVLPLRKASIAPTLPSRRLLVVAVHDYDPDLASAEDVQAVIDQQISDAFSSIKLPDGYNASKLSDIYRIETALLPNQKHFPTPYDQAIVKLRTVLLDADKHYTDAGLTPARLQESVDKVQDALGDRTTQDLPAERELSATFACNAAMQRVLEQYRSNSRTWKSTVEAGRTVPNFGTENDRLIQSSLEAYDRDAAPHASSRAFHRKKEELKSVLLSDAYALFAKQILKVREDAYQVFRAKLTRIRINDQVEKNVRGAVKFAENYFVERGESLRSKLGNWRFDNERNELVNHIRDDATERLQLARLQGNYVPRMRAPIGFAFHTLLLAPFGRDSRLAHPHADDMKQTYDPDKIKQAGLMRVRAMQRNQIISFRPRDVASPEKIEDLFGPLFEEEESSKK